MFKFPDSKPMVQPDPHGWFDKRIINFLKTMVKPEMTQIIELGAWLGLSTRWFCQNSKAQVYSIDHWKGSIEHQGREDVASKLPTLYDTFIVNCWEHKDRITPIKTDTITGLNICKDMGIKPELIFIDASHEYEDVLKDLETAYNLFPEAILVGDDWSWKNVRLEYRYTVREAVVKFARDNKKRIIISQCKRCWRLL